MLKSIFSIYSEYSLLRGVLCYILTLLIRKSKKHLYTAVMTAWPWKHSYLSFRFFIVPIMLLYLQRFFYAFREKLLSVYSRKDIFSPAVYIFHRSIYMYVIMFRDNSNINNMTVPLKITEIISMFCLWQEMNSVIIHVDIIAQVFCKLIVNSIVFVRQFKKEICYLFIKSM